MTATFNKHRYRNFFIGFAISCGLTLFAFNYKTDYNIGEIVEVMPDNDTYGVQVVSVKLTKKQIIKEKPRPNKTLEANNDVVGARTYIFIKGTQAMKDEKEEMMRRVEDKKREEQLNSGQVEEVVEEDAVVKSSGNHVSINVDE